MNVCRIRYSTVTDKSAHDSCDYVRYGIPNFRSSTNNVKLKYRRMFTELVDFTRMKTYCILLPNCVVEH